DFVWHDHPDTDEVFLVIEGAMEIEFRDRSVQVAAGELFVIPKGIEHITRAKDECKVMLIEPRGVINTGAVTSELTAANDEWI
ncbi:MAG: cupin domain-containing protein, partial [Cyanobacteria bacterium J06632_3]